MDLQGVHWLAQLVAAFGLITLGVLALALVALFLLLLSGNDGIKLIQTIRGH